MDLHTPQVYSERRMPFTHDEKAKTSQATPLQLNPRAGRRAGTSYAEGAAALSPRVQAKEGDKTPEQKEKERQAAAKKSYEELLGSTVGGKMYELVNKHLSSAKILKHGEKGLDSALKSLVGQVKPIDGFSAMDTKEEAAAAAAFAKAVGGWANDEAKEWLKGSSGQAFTADVAKWFEGHPKAVVVLALVAAAGAVAANVDIPTLKHKINLGDSAKLSLGVDLGKIREIAFAGAQATLSWNKGELGYTYKAGDKADQHKIAAKLGDDKQSLTASAIQEGDKLVLDAKAAMQGMGYSASAGLKHTNDDGKKATLGTVRVKLGDKDQNLTADASLNPETGALTFGLSQLYREGPLALRHTMRMGGDKGSSTGLGMDYENQQKKFKLSLDYEMTELRGDFLSGKLDKKWGDKDEWSLAASGKYSLTDDRLLSLGTQFGFRDKDEFRGFLVDYKHTFKEDGLSLDQLGVMVEHSVGNVMLRGQNRTTLVGGDLAGNVTQAHAGVALNKDWTLIGGGKYGYQPDHNPHMSDNDRGAWIQAGAQYKKIPLVLGYRPEDKSFSFGITIPFGR